MENRKQIFLNSNVDWFEAQLMMEICWVNSGLASKLPPPPVLLLTVATAGRLFPPLSI